MRVIETPAMTRNKDRIASAPTAAQPWPAIMLPLKLLAQPGDTGAGDIIERVIGPLGGDAFKIWYESTFRRKCGCNRRKEHWNNKYPLKP